MKSPSEAEPERQYMIEIDTSLRHAKRLLVDAEWNGDEEAEKSLRREIERLEMLKSYGETHDVPW